MLTLVIVNNPSVVVGERILGIEINGLGVISNSQFILPLLVVGKPSVVIKANSAGHALIRWPGCNQ